jgi:hypothetical protein
MTSGKMAVMKESQSSPASPRRIWIDVLILGILLVFNAILLVVKGTERFEFFDMSAFLDAGYRVSIGQVPYVDFYYTTGPVHLYMHALSFVLFGFTKIAVLVHLCTVGLAATAIVYAISRKHFGRLPSAGLAVLAIFSFYGPLCHPWYDQNASIFIFIGILFWEFRWNKSPTLVSLSCGILAALSFLTKSNVGLAGGLVLLSLVATQPRPVKQVAIYVAAGLLSLGVWMLILRSPGNFVDQAFFAYRAGERLLDFQRFYNSIRTSFNVLILLMGWSIAILAGKNWMWANRSRLIFFSSLIFAGIFTNWTSSLPGNLVWLSLQFLYLFALAVDLDLTRFGRNAAHFKRVIWLILITAWMGCTIISVSRTHRLIAWSWNPAVEISDYEMQTASFKGWRCNAATGEGLDLAVEFIRTRIPPDESIMVFPDATVIYGLAGRESYRNVPFIFHTGHTTNGRWRDECRQHFLAEPPKWFVMHERPSPVDAAVFGPSILESLDLKNFFDQNFREVWRHGEFRIYRLTSSSSNESKQQ